MIYKGRPDDACYDLTSMVDAEILPGDWAKIQTGFKIDLPPGYVALVFARSGIASNYNVTLTNSVGVIDPGYQGDVSVLLSNHGPGPFVIKKGDRIAQLMILRTAKVSLRFGAFRKTERGADGFGSSGGFKKKKDFKNELHL